MTTEIGAPTLVAGDHHYSSLSLGWNFTCALDGGRAFCWGENANGQLGDGSITDRRAPVPVAGGLTFRSIAAGATHACGITPRGEAYCWGNNSGGQLGDGTRVSREVPTAVKTSLRFVAIATGALHTCALTADGEAFCWGRDNYGQLGDGGERRIPPSRFASWGTTRSPRSARSDPTPARRRPLARRFAGATISTASWATAPG